jgi:pimeloyl-ACP methyl ester carboxylesterase
VAGSVEGAPRLAYGRTGAGPDPVVALHGITTTHRAFTTVARALRHPDGMAALDLRGRGDSGKPARGYGLHAHAGDVVRLMDALGLGRGVLVGHSMGGYVATQTALDHPDRVKGLVLLDGGWARAGWWRRRLQPDRKALRAGLKRAFSRLDMTFPDLDALVAYWFPGSGLGIDDLPPDVADAYRYDVEPVPGGWRPKASAAACRTDARWNVLRAPTARALGRIGCPVALVRASQGFTPGTPATFSEPMRAHLAGRLELRADLLVEGATHYSLLADPANAATVAGVIDDLVEQLA